MMGSGRPRPTSPPTATRTSSPAANASASASPAPRGGARGDHLRRAGQRARRLGPGSSPQPARGPAASDSGSPICSSRTTSVVEHMSERITVMYLGASSRSGRPKPVARQPSLHPGAPPRAVDPDPTSARIVPSGRDSVADNPPSGCPFHPRCPRAMARCQRRGAAPCAKVAAGHSQRLPPERRLG